MRTQRMEKIWTMPTYWSCGQYLATKASLTSINISDSENLTYQQRQDIQELVQEYADIFTERPAITQLEQHPIETITKDPFKVKSYPVPYAMRDLSREKWQ